MTKRNSRNYQYVGKAGQLAAMGELSWRGYNVAIPEIDIGDDVFAVSDKSGSMAPTSEDSESKETKEIRCVPIKVKKQAIELAQSPEVHFVFAMRIERGWRFLVMDRSVLRNYVVTRNIGTPADNGRYRRLDIVLGHDGNAVCAGLDWTNHLEDWAAWPHLE